ncbi:hypothetical protein KPL70_002701 [Citrus sinensis]|nr:hypothetical protein KPL70_002701 [Citrus sinensis]
MDSNGYKTHVENGIMKIIKGALVLMKAEKIGANLLMLKGETLHEADPCVASNGEESTMMWHLKLGHMLEQGLKILSEKKLLLGLKSMLMYPIKKKSDVFPVFKEYKARVELESGKKIKCLRTDNGGEYTEGEFLAFCKQENIQRQFMVRQFTVAYTLQQNGVAEQMNKTLTERIRAMLRTVGLHNSFWAKATKTACYIVNRSPSTTIGLKTTMEMWTEKPADYSYLHAFGCPVYDPNTYKIVISRDVIFVEDQLQMRDEDDDTKKEKSETVPVYVENNPEDSDYSEAAPEHEEQEPVETEAPEVRRSTRERRPPTWHSEYVTEINVAYCLLTEDEEPSTFHETLESLDVILWMTAMQEEIEALHKNKTWELVPLPRGRKAIGNKWVYKINRDGNDQVEQYRARLVVKGYAKKECIDFNEIFSPVVQLTIIRVVLTMCATFDLHLEQLDVKTVFLHGELEEEIYMLQPEGFVKIKKENLVCRFSSDHCAYYKRFEDNDFIILLLYVDDMLGAERKEMSRVSYASAVGSLMFAMICTRPDIAQTVGAVNRYMANPGGEHLIAVKRILRYIRGTSDVTLCYGGSEFTVRGYVDSDFAGDLHKRKSTTSYVFTLAGAPVSWVLKLQTVVALSTTEAEYMVATQACKEAIWIQRLLEELGHKQEKISVFCDSQSALHIARNPAFHSRTKHIRVQYHFIREVVEDGNVDLQKIHTKENLADVLTKPINTDKFIWSRSSCGLAET